MLVVMKRIRDKIMSSKSEITLIDTPEARQIVLDVVGKGVSLPTMIAWVEKYKLGRRLGGRWKIDKEKLTKFLEGDQ